MRTNTLMYAIVYGNSGVLKLEEVDKPGPADHEVLLKVRAASVNLCSTRNVERGE